MVLQKQYVTDYKTLNHTISKEMVFILADASQTQKPNLFNNDHYYRSDLDCRRIRTILDLQTK